MTFSPLQNPDAYDFMWIGGVETPGICTIDGAGRKFAVEKKKGKGSSGAESTYQGQEIPEFKVTLKLWEQEHFDGWEALKTVLLKANEGSQPTALDVYHPELEALNITHVIVEEVGQKVQVTEGDTLYTVTFAFSEYHPPKKAGGTAKKSTAKNDEPPLPVGLSEEEMNRLVAENAGETPDETQERQVEEENPV